MFVHPFAGSSMYAYRSLYGEFLVATLSTNMTAPGFSAGSRSFRMGSATVCVCNELEVVFCQEVDKKDSHSAQTVSQWSKCQSG